MSTKAGRITIKDVRQGKTAFIVLLHLGKGKHCFTSGPRKVFILGRPRKGMVELRDAQSMVTSEVPLTHLGVVSDPANMLTWEEAGTLLTEVGDKAGGLFATEKAAQHWLDGMDAELVSLHECTDLMMEVIGLKQRRTRLLENLKLSSEHRNVPGTTEQLQAEVEWIEKALRGDEEVQEPETVLLEEMGDDDL